jgi:hypothetical protein
VHACQVANTNAERGKFPFELCRRQSLGRLIGGRFSRGQRPLFGLAPELVFEMAPLAAEFRLTGSAPRNHFGIVARQRELADFKTLGQVAEQHDPRRDQVAGYMSGQVVNLVCGRFRAVICHSWPCKCSRTPATGRRLVLAAVLLDYAHGRVKPGGHYWIHRLPR